MLLIGAMAICDDPPQEEHRREAGHRGPQLSKRGKRQCQYSEGQYQGRPTTYTLSGILNLANEVTWLRATCYLWSVDFARLPSAPHLSTLQTAVRDKPP